MDPYKMAIFPVGIPYLLQKPKHPYCRYFSLQVPSGNAGATAKHLLTRAPILLFLINPDCS